MNREPQTRIAAIKAECEELTRLSAQAMCGTTYDSPFTIKARNVSPAMARVVLMSIDDGMAQGDDVFLEIIADRWEGKL